MQTKKQILVTVFPVQQQAGVVDGGIFGIAFLQYILSCKQKPVRMSFE